ncbi:hypothetical protein DP130_01500 [Clostridium tetani]|uniref:Uncharacterized protein n=1 Tax=Clostridium tetani TaxID=1513 RepID=A0A4Q0VFT5_CLOTA|nr:hypothetical protein [Clostridium tetani]RXI50670.1 hypothetical protein DP130_01500 [Clostridium tetani]
MIIIRSQSRETLGNYKELGINKNRILGYSHVSEYCTCLGEYKTEERALEVLDMIQERIISGTKSDSIWNGTRTTKDCVFEMPEE